MNETMIFDVTMPSILKEGAKYPVIYAMHGRGSDEKDIMALVEPLKEKAILVALRGPLDLGGGYEYFSIKGFGNPEIPSFEAAINQIENFIDVFSKNNPVDTQRQFLTGFSQGGILSMSLALKMGPKIKGIAALSGYIPDHAKDNYKADLSKLSVFIGHGQVDPIFPVTIGQQNKEYFDEVAQKVEFKSYPVGHQISMDEQDDVLAWLEKQMQ